ncbi:Golgin subfamily A member 6-like protein 1 [Bienertia sinuspersici]
MSLFDCNRNLGLSFSQNRFNSSSSNFTVQFHSSFSVVGYSSPMVISRPHHPHLINPNHNLNHNYHVVHPHHRVFHHPPPPPHSYFQRGPIEISFAQPSSGTVANSISLPPEKARMSICQLTSQRQSMMVNL